MKNKKEFLKFLLITVFSVFLIAIIVKAATTIGTNITTGGTLTVDGNATTSGNLIVGSSSWAVPTSTLTVVGTAYINNKATTSEAFWVGIGGTANNLDLAGGDLYVQGATELDGASYLTGAATLSSTLNVTGLTTFTTATGTSATTTKYLMVGVGFTLPSTFNYDGDLAVSSDAVIGGNTTTTNAIINGNATTTGNMVIGYNKQATSGATTTVTFGSYNGGAAGNGVCLKFRQGGGWVYCVAGEAGISCGATSCE